MKYIVSEIRQTSPINIILRGSIVISFIITFLYFIYLFFHNIGNIFMSWDAVVSWNRWAVEWAKGVLPTGTMHYPQLIPTLFSLSYVFIGDVNVQFFARMLMPLFPLVLLAMYFDLWIKLKKDAFLLAAIISSVLIVLFNSVSQLTDGYVDVAVACLGFGPIYYLIGNEAITDLRHRKSNYILAALALAGAALTKQAGIYILLMYPVILLTGSSIHAQNCRKSRDLICSLLLATFLVLPWYAYTEVRIQTGNDTSEVSKITGYHHQGRTAIQRVKYATTQILMSLDNSPTIKKVVCNTFGGCKDEKLAAAFLYGFIALGILLCLFDRERWKYAALLCIPYGCIWMFTTSYDLRNLSFIAPCIGLSVGIGFSDRKSKNWKLMTVFAGILFLVIAVFANNYISPAMMRARQTALQKHIGDIGINTKIYELLANSGDKKKIITNYLMMSYLPGLSDYCKINKMQVYETFVEDVISEKNGYVLIVNWAYHAISVENANRLVAQNLLQEIPTDGTVKLYKIVSRLN